jgi:hypothetical protein
MYYVVLAICEVLKNCMYYVVSIAICEVRALITYSIALKLNNKLKMRNNLIARYYIIYLQTDFTQLNYG